MKKLIFLLTAFLLCGCSQNKVAVTELTAVKTSTSVSEEAATVFSETTASLTTTVAESSREETTVLTAISETPELSETATAPPEDTMASEIILITEAVEATSVTVPVTEPPAEIKYEKVGYGDFLKYRKVFKKPEDKTNPTGGYPQYINVDGIIYHNRSYIPSRDIDINEHFINDEWFNENIKPCFSDGIVTKEKLFALEIIGEGSGEYDVIPLEDFRTYRIYSTYRYLSDNIIVSNENGKTGFKIWVRHEYFTELCRVARLLWEISMEYEISEITQLTYMFTEKPDVLEINVPVEYREQIEAYLEENNVSKDIYIFTEAEE